MNRFILLLSCAALLSSCESVIVWTLGDVFGLSCLAIVIIYVITSIIRDLYFPKKKEINGLIFFNNLFFADLSK